jgi:hypothetical protein
MKATHFPQFPANPFPHKCPWGKPCYRELVEILHPDGGCRVVCHYPSGEEYNIGYRSGGVWVDSWWS